METTPNDLRQQQFEIKFRGYNPDDVEVFRDLAAAALEETKAEALKLSEENNHLNERLKHLIAMEDTLKAAMVEAQKNAEITLDNAKREAQVVVSQAKKEAELIIRDANTKYQERTGDLHQTMGKLVADINKIRFIKSQYLNQLKTMVSSQLKVVDEAIAEDDTEEADLTPPAPSAESNNWRAQAHTEPEENLEGFESDANSTGELPIQDPMNESMAEPTQHVEQGDMLEGITGNETGEIPIETPESVEEPQAEIPTPAPIEETQEDVSAQASAPAEEPTPNEENKEKQPAKDPKSEEWQDLEEQLKEE